MSNKTTLRRMGWNKEVARRDAEVKRRKMEKRARKAVEEERERAWMAIPGPSRSAPRSGPRPGLEALTGPPTESEDEDEEDEEEEDDKEEVNLIQPTQGWKVGPNTPCWYCRKHAKTCTPAR